MAFAEHAENVTPMPVQHHAIDRNIETLIRSRLAAVTQADLARAIGRNPSTVNRWFSGEASVPVEHIGALLDALGLVVITREEHVGLRRWAARSLLDGLHLSEGL